MAITSTTSKLIKKVEDVTTPPRRMQSEVAQVSEAGEVKPSPSLPLSVPVPNMMTPEKVITWYEDLIVETNDSDLRKVFRFTIKQLKELLSYKYDDDGK